MDNIKLCSMQGLPYKKRNLRYCNSVSYCPYSITFKNNKLCNPEKRGDNPKFPIGKLDRIIEEAY